MLLGKADTLQLAACLLSPQIAGSHSSRTELTSLWPLLIKKKKVFSLALGLQSLQCKRLNADLITVNYN